MNATVATEEYFLEKMELHVPGLIAIIIFYVLIAVAGLLASWFTRKRKSTSASETIMVGARDIGRFVGVCTMSATWIGGAAINGSAESVYDPEQGLLWTFAIPGYGIGLMVNALFFVRKMRDGNYVTAIDPVQAKLGKYFGFVVFFVELFNDVVYAAAILTALGGTLEVVAGLPRIPAVIVSTAISVLYTMVGGMYSVAYTDLIQLGMMIFGLVLAAPFTLTNDAVGSIVETAHIDGGWLGNWSPDSAGTYIDLWLLVVFGGIPLQQIYQRVFSADTTKNAQILLIGAGIFSFFSIIPSVLIGAAGSSTNWTMTTFMGGNGTSPADLGYQRLILPIALQYLTPPVVAFFGLGAVSAAVMSSTDSTLLAAGSLFGRNIYRNLMRPRASELEIVIVIRIVIVLVGVAAAAISLTSNSVVAFLYLCSDFSYAVYFPMFVSVLYLDPNAYGAIPGIAVGLVLRIGGGESLLNWDPPFSYMGGANFPVRTVAAISSFITLTVFSYLAKVLFENGYIPEKYDFLESNLARGGRTRYLQPISESRQEENELREIYANESVVTAAPSDVPMKATPSDFK